MFDAIVELCYTITMKQKPVFYPKLEELMDSETMADWIRSANLTEAEGDCLAMSLLSYSFTEMGRRYEISRATVRKYIDRALEKLRNCHMREDF